MKILRQIAVAWGRNVFSIFLHLLHLLFLAHPQRYPALTIMMSFQPTKVIYVSTVIVEVVRWEITIALKGMKLVIQSMMWMPIVD